MMYDTLFSGCYFTDTNGRKIPRNTCFLYISGHLPIKETGHDFAGQENPFIIYRSKEINIYFKTNNKIPIDLLK